MAWIGLLTLGLALPPIAAAETVTGDARAGLLAAAPDGTPRVAYAVGTTLTVATRGAAGWSGTPAALLPGPSAFLAGFTGSSVLAEDSGGRWLVLAEETASGWRSTTLVPSLAAGARLGVAGLAADATGRPVLAYAVEQASQATALRLVRGGKTVDITRDGFPKSSSPPSAQPVVLRSGQVRVVETFAPRGAAAIEWRPSGRTWVGQFLQANTLGSPFGAVAALAGPAGVYSAWSEDFPGFGETHVVVASHEEHVSSSVVLRHAFLTGLVLGSNGLEVAANDWVDTSAGRVYAGVVAGAARAELDGRLLGYRGDGSSRQLLLAGPDGLAWFAAPEGLHVSVSLAAGPSGLSGSVTGAAGGSVQLYREGTRAFVATLPLGPDGTFSLPVPSPGLYRAVYADPVTGVPYASLLRRPAP